MQAKGVLSEILFMINANVFFLRFKLPTIKICSGRSFASMYSLKECVLCTSDIVVRVIMITVLSLD